MRLLKMQCTACGRLVDTNKGPENLPCPHCKRKINVEKALKKFEAFMETAPKGAGKDANVAEFLTAADKLAANRDYAGAQNQLNIGLDKSPANFKLWFKAFKVALDADDFEQASEFFAIAEKTAGKENAGLITENEFQTLPAIPFFASFEKVVQMQREEKDAAEELHRQKAARKALIEADEDEDEDFEFEPAEEEEEEEEETKKPEFILYYHMCRNVLPTENDRVVIYFGNRRDITVHKPPSPYNFYTFLIINRLSPYEMSVTYGEFDCDAPFKNGYMRAPLVMPTTLTVPYSAGGDTAVPENRYAGLNKIKAVEISEGIIEIGSGAFEGCVSLTSVTFPKSLKKIGARAFHGCTALAAVNLSDVTDVGARAFENCKELRSAELCAEMSVIDEGVFAECKKLNIKALPPALTAIKREAFLNCSDLKKISLPETLAEIGEKAFFDCGLFNFSLIPPSIQRIGAFAFAGTLLEKANLLGPCTSKTNACKAMWIGFVRIFNSKSVIRHEKRQFDFAAVENAEIGDGAFSNCKYLREIHLGRVKTLGAEIFANSQVKIYVEFPEPVHTGWNPDWNGAGFGKKMPYYKRFGKGLSYKLMK